jgi:trehalose/maltose hydrolase-like predicted phosphorylase
MLIRIQAQTGGEQPISTLPTWSSLYLTIDGATYTVGVDPSQIANWTQVMSIENGVVSTSLTWKPSPSGSGFKLKYTIFAHRTRPNLGIVRLDVSGLSSTSTATVTDVLDGAGAWRTTTVGKGVLPNGPDSTIYSAVQPNGISNVTAFEISRLHFMTPSPGKAINGTGCFSGVSQNASTASQCYAAKPSEGELTVVKYVGIASSDAFKGIEMQTALKATTDAVSKGYDSLLKEHTAAWAALWADADIIIPGDSSEMQELQLVTRASLFHLLSNVRQGSEPTGLGDNSIAPAGLTSDSYSGQIFWDGDTWMFPGLHALFPSYAASITNFRFRQLGAAEENVKMFDRSGAIYPWMGARFGNCTYVFRCFTYYLHP